ncbi:VOC family protein [Vibrio sp. PP-XX7]
MRNLLTSLRLTPELMSADVDEFMAKIEQLCQRLALDLSVFELDHIAMRLNEQAVAEAVHQAWLTQGKVVSDAMIHGRPIIVIALTQGLQLSRWCTHHVELPYPAEGKYYSKQGWEHVEFVIPSQATSIEAFQAELFQRFPLLYQQWSTLEQRGIQVKCSSPQGKGERLANPTIAFKWAGVCIKLHPYALRDVIDSEQPLSLL